MRIVMVSTWEAQCGIATYTRDLRGALLAQGHEVDVVAIDRTEVKYLARRELRTYFRALAQRCAGYDVVHVQHEHGMFAGVHPLPVGAAVTRDFLVSLRRLGVPVFVTFHSEPIDAHLPATTFGVAAGGALRAHFRATMAMTFRRHPGLRAIVHSRSTRRAFVDGGVPAAAVDVVPLGMRSTAGPPPTEAERRAARERLGLDPDAVHLVQFGFLAAYKGITTTVEALRHLPADVELSVLGDVHPHGGDETLERILESLDEAPSVGTVPLGGRVRLHGWVPAEDLPDWRAAASFAVAPYERVSGFSSSAALTWAFDAGVPTIASRVPAFVELHEKAGCLALVAPGSPRELAHRITRLREDPEAAAALAAAGRAYADTCAWDRVAALHVALYADQAAESRTNGSTSFRSARSASRINGSSTSQPGADISDAASTPRTMRNGERAT